MEIISAKYLVTMDTDPIVDGAIAVENGEILDVGTEEELLSRYTDFTHQDYANHVLMPGLINAHTHLDMTLHKDYPSDPVRSMEGSVNYIDWLLQGINYKRQSSEQKLREAVEEGLALSIESGTTCVGDMGNFDGVFQSLEGAGIRAVIFPEVLSYDSRVAKDLYETAMAMVEKYADMDSELISVGMAPYSAFTLSRNILKILSQYCRSANIPLMIHAAESFSEMEFFYNSTGDIALKLFPNIGWGEDLPPAFQKTPVEYLNEIGFLQASPILVGCNHVTTSDLERIAATGSKVVWCPRSAHYLKEGRAPIASMLMKNIPVALATEGLSSTNSLSLWDEMRFAHEVFSSSQHPLNAYDLLKMTTSNAAQVLGLSNEVGKLSKGLRADYIVVDESCVNSIGEIYDDLVRNVRGYHIHRVVVNGNPIKTLN